MATILDLFGQNGKAETRNPDLATAQVHFFPLGGINKTAGFLPMNSGPHAPCRAPPAPEESKEQ